KEYEEIAKDLRPVFLQEKWLLINLFPEKLEIDFLDKSVWATKQNRYIVDGKMISRSKPDPQIFMMGADMIRCAYEDCVVFEDAESGAEAAHKAGMFCVGVGNTKLHADCMIKDFKKFTLDNLIHLYRKK
ncbi:MAG: HAD-IA family hydrolase, partial [Rikenellaceae bacterium]